VRHFPWDEEDTWIHNWPCLGKASHTKLKTKCDLMIQKPTIQPSAVVTHTKSVLAYLPMLARETKASQLTKKRWHIDKPWYRETKGDCLGFRVFEYRRIMSRGQRHIKMQLSCCMTKSRTIAFWFISIVSISLYDCVCPSHPLTYYFMAESTVLGFETHVLYWVVFRWTVEQMVLSISLASSLCRI
jgi:hypothetical protein